MVYRPLSRLAIWLVPMLLMFAAAGQALADPPSRVARLSYVDGDVSMQPSGLDEWSQARINRPLVTGDSLYSDRASRLEMEIGGATMRLDERTAFRLLNLDDDSAQVELTSGTLSLTVRKIFDGQTYEIDTPTLALVIQTPGQYRVDISPKGDSTMVSVVDGNGEVYGRDNASFRVRQGESYRFYDSQLKDYEVFDLPREDDFDRWCYERTERYERSPSRRYVSEDMIGYADLDDYGSWSTAPSYGSIWYPSRVDIGWTPYRDGHWSWIDPWGWTWVDSAAWGFAPSHYGRWAYVGSRWGWVPGPRRGRSIYAPALVAFVGGGGFSVSISSGGPIGWFPLGPRDVYVPWYRGSRDYFNNINVRNTTIINNTYITNVYNDYSRGRTVNNFNYAYQNDRRAYTAVSRDAFINARAVNSARVQVTQAQLTQGRVVSRVEMAPTRQSFVGGNAVSGSRANVQAATFNREVIARTAPPAPRLDAKERIQAISRNNNQPLAVSQMRELSTSKPAAEERQMRRVQVVGGERPAATAVPSRTGPDSNARLERQSRSGEPAREDSQRERNPAGVRIDRKNDDAPAGTIRAPRTDRSERNVPAAGQGPTVDRDERSGRAITTRPSVERDASGQSTSAPDQRRPETIRAPRPERTERTSDQARPGQTVERNEPATRTINAPEQRRPATIRANPEDVQRSRDDNGSDRAVDPPARRMIEQRQPVQREEPARRESAPMQERRVAPQQEQRSAPPQERRDVQPRNMPRQEIQQAQPRYVAPQERREVQPQQRQPVQQRQAVQNLPAQKAQQRKTKSDTESQDDNKDNQHKRRERN